MAKEKSKSWEGKKKFYKDGNPDIFRGFNYWQWKNMTDPEKSHWTEFSEVSKAPIPKEVIDFEKKIKGEIPDVFEDEDVDEPLSEIEAVRAKLKELGIKFTWNSKLETLQKKLADATDTE